ncbi:M14 family metallopeptidase [Aquimarina sp. TRL1]|uniref:M14 family metallopeptidase n=1 Tax=Aquimarina sp. (strain TRL1) TaxID=2736252 RepID=UPI00158E556C|nr:M14 family metallopeptidase [Aquimarina sp. TRL1]QKX03501.1 M14 family metallopeptidase [Aquimarina sp. TRL1]
MKYTFTFFQYTLLILLLLTSCTTTTNSEKKDIDFTTTFEKSRGTETPTYQEVISYYKKLADAYPQIHLQEIGMTDSGFPLHVISLHDSNETRFDQLRKTKRILLINNGIHPGESDGIDATILLYRDIVQGKIPFPKHTALVTIPIYNIGGSLNRNSTSRTNQNGPKSYGFRGNARNFDLNRDFIKNDTKNSQAFSEVFHLVQPDVFIDNHVSNGADYQYTLTHLFTQHNKLGGPLGTYLHQEIQPTLTSLLEEKKWDITPYVNVWGQTPDKGFTQFMDHPRYSTGYTTLWNTLGMMIETHMLKPYKQRVEGTYELMKSMIDIIENDPKKIKQLREQAFSYFDKQTTYPIQWKIDTTRHSTFLFKGYEGKRIPSTLTQGTRLKYYREQPYQKEITYRDYFIPSKQVTIPAFYVIPQGWWRITDALKRNQVAYQRLSKDTTITVETYKIQSYKTRNSPYEGHYLHYDTQVSKKENTMTFRKGDYLIPTAQKAIRYIIEVLEPEAPDSFFNWNYLDTILQQKEGFSPYVWEDKAIELLEKHPELKARFIEKQKDTSFRKNSYRQLDWLHKQSSNYEKAHMKYPIYRILR